MDPNRRRIFRFAWLFLICQSSVVSGLLKGWVNSINKEKGKEERTDDSILISWWTVPYLFGVYLFAEEYTSFPQVLEPNWHMMCNKMQNAKSIDEVRPSSTFGIHIYFAILKQLSSYGVKLILMEKCIFVEQVIQYHDSFLDKCLKECLLLLPELLKVCFWNPNGSYLDNYIYWIG